MLFLSTAAIFKGFTAEETRELKSNQPLLWLDDRVWLFFNIEITVCGVLPCWVWLQRSQMQQMHGAVPALVCRWSGSDRLIWSLRTDTTYFGRGGGGVRDVSRQVLK